MLTQRKRKELTWKEREEKNYFKRRDMKRKRKEFTEEKDREIKKLT